MVTFEPLDGDVLDVHGGQSFGSEGDIFGAWAVKMTIPGWVFRHLEASGEPPKGHYKTSW